jgi:hypothetical protein
VTSVTPASGPTAGGTAVTVDGSGFTGAVAVDFGSVPASRFTVVSDSQIAAVAPPGTGTVDLTVTTSAGVSATSTADQFTYGSVQPVVTVTVNGQAVGVAVPPMPAGLYQLYLPTTVDNQQAYLPGLLLEVLPDGAITLNPSNLIVVPLPGNLPAGPPQSVTAVWTQGGSVAATQTLPLWSLDPQAETVRLIPPAGLAPGTYQFTIDLNYASQTALTVGPQTYRLG